MRYTVHLYDTQLPSAFSLVTRITNALVKNTLYGHDTLEVTVDADHQSITARLYNRTLGIKVFTEGRVLFDGDITETIVEDDKLTYIARGKWKSIDRIQTLDAFWSSEILTEATQEHVQAFGLPPMELTTMSGAVYNPFTFTTVSGNYAIALNELEEIADNAGAFYTMSVKGSPLFGRFLKQTESMAFDVRLPTGFTAEIFLFDDQRNLLYTDQILIGTGEREYRSFTNDQPVRHNHSFIGIVNRNGTQYTSTEEDGYWYLNILYYRSISDPVNSFSVDWFDPVVSGIQVPTDPLSQTRFMYPGQKVVYFDGTTGSGSVATVLNITNNLVDFDIPVEITPFSGFFFPISLAQSLIVQSLAQEITPHIDLSQFDLYLNDIQEYSVQAALPSKIIEEFIAPTIPQWAFGSKGNFGFYYEYTPDTYYASLKDFNLRINTFDAVSQYRLRYIDEFGFEVYTELITTPISYFLPSNQVRDIQIQATDTEAINRIKADIFNLYSQFMKQSTLRITELYGANNQPVSLMSIQPGDGIEIRDVLLPQAFPLRFTVTAIEYNLVEGTVDVQVDMYQPTLDNILSTSNLL